MYYGTGFLQHWTESRDTEIDNNNNNLNACNSSTHRVDQPPAPLSAPCSLCRDQVRCGGYPRSDSLRRAGWEAEWFARLCSRADRTCWSHDDRSVEHNEAGKMAMKIIDSDRLLFAEENGYYVQPRFMTPYESSPKNHILIGVYLQH